MFQVECFKFTTKMDAIEEEIVVQVDPNRLTLNAPGKALGFEKPGGFEEVTNFSLCVSGYVGDGHGNVTGYILGIDLAVVDPLNASSEDGPSHKIHLTNREMGNHTTIINALTKIPALWIAQSKETFLPQYIYNLCRDYMSSDDDKKRYEPVEVIGKQPNNIWVFNESVHMDHSGSLIPIREHCFLINKDGKLPLLTNVTGDFDNGEALGELIQAEKELLQNNFPQALMCHAASGMAANYDLLIEEFDGCPTPVLMGEPLSGKTTAMKAALSVFGIAKCFSECSSKFVEKMQSMTTVPFGWDDSSNLKAMKNVTVNSYNACGSANLMSSLKPHTVPLITTNEECNETKIKSRWMPIVFERLSPQLQGIALIKAQKKLKKKRKTAHKSIAVLTSYLHDMISNYEVDEECMSCQESLQNEISSKNYTLDQRAFDSFTLIAFCSKKILTKVDLLPLYDEIWQKIADLILPSYCNSNKTKKSLLSVSSQNNDEKITHLLKVQLPSAVLQTDKSVALKFFDQEFRPKTCTCGIVVAFNSKLALQCVKDVFGAEVTQHVTEEAIRAYIKSNGIGCVGKQVKFRMLSVGQQLRAVHVKRQWFEEETIVKLDHQFGRRKPEKKQSKIGNVTNKTSTASDMGRSSIYEQQDVINIDDNILETENSVAKEPNIPDLQQDITAMNAAADNILETETVVKEANISDLQQDIRVMNAETTNSVVEEPNSSDNLQQDQSNNHGTKRRNTRNVNILQDNLSKNFLPRSCKRSKRL